MSFEEQPQTFDVMLNRRMNRRRAIGTSAKIGIGAAVAVVAAGGVAAYYAAQPSTVQTSTQTPITASTTQTTPTASATVTPVSFVHWDFHPSEIQQFNAMFEQEYGVPVSDTLIPFPSYQSTVSSREVAGQRYDLLYALNVYEYQWLNSGWGRTVGDLPDASTIKNAIYPNWLPLYTTPSGELYSLPYFCAFYVFYYNKKIAADNGFEEPKTYDDIYNQCKKLKQNGMAAPFTGWWSLSEGMEEEFLSACYGNGVEVFDSGGNPMFEGNSGLLSVLNWFRNMWNDGLTSKDILTENLNTQFASMLSGNSYMHWLHHYYWGLFGVASTASSSASGASSSTTTSQAGNIVWTSKPPGTADKTLGFGGVYLLGSSPKNLDGAWELDKFYGWKDKNGNYVVRDAWNKDNFLLSSYPEWFNSQNTQNTINSLTPGLYDLTKTYFSQYTVVPAYRQLPWYSTWATYANQTLQKMITGEINVSDTPKLLEDKAKELKSGSSTSTT